MTMLDLDLEWSRVGLCSSPGGLLLGHCSLVVVNTQYTTTTIHHHHHLNHHLSNTSTQNQDSAKEKLVKTVSSVQLT